ncbi:MAG: ribose 5-phosphate isomerase B [Deltaproteobacteria bacterium]|nr:ribose 5-phosphate isomerase B [Deltaproteobacteria bacterium]
MDKKIAIASDHAGRELKDDLIDYLKELGAQVVDMGVNSNVSVDYPDYGSPLADRVSSGEIDKGVLICGTGIGMSILANKFKGVRAALVSDVYSARMSREHNDANVLVIGGRIVGKGLAREILKTWLTTKFEGGRHQRRLDKITEVENRTVKKD